MLRNEQPPKHLDYLLTAYLFENLSAAGRTEVETHLAHCPACRHELESLRAVLGIAESAFDNGGKEYVFEEQRKRRVLEAAKNSRHNKIILNDSSTWKRNRWKFLAAAAMLLIMAVVVLPFVNKVTIKARSNRSDYDEGESLLTINRLERNTVTTPAPDAPHSYARESDSAARRSDLSKDDSTRPSNSPPITHLAVPRDAQQQAEAAQGTVTTTPSGAPVVTLSGSIAGDSQFAAPSAGKALGSPATPPAPALPPPPSEPSFNDWAASRKSELSQSGVGNSPTSPPPPPAPPMESVDSAIIAPPIRYATEAPMDQKSRGLSSESAPKVPEFGYAGATNYYINGQSATPAPGKPETAQLQRQAGDMDGDRKVEPESLGRRWDEAGGDNQNGQKEALGKAKSQMQLNGNPEPLVPERYRLASPAQPDANQKGIALADGTELDTDKLKDLSDKKDGKRADLGLVPPAEKPAAEPAEAPVAGAMPKSSPSTNFGLGFAPDPAAQPKAKPQSGAALNAFDELKKVDGQKSQQARGTDLEGMNRRLGDLSDGKKPKEEMKTALMSDRDTHPTDPTSKEMSAMNGKLGELSDGDKAKIDARLTNKAEKAPEGPQAAFAPSTTIPPDLVKQNESGDRYQNLDLGRMDTSSALGSRDAPTFHSVKGSDDAAGGGGADDNRLEDMITAGAARSPGTGGGWGGAHGTGAGSDNGEGRGAFGSRSGSGRKMMVKRAPAPAAPGATESENKLNRSLDNLDDNLSASNFGLHERSRQYGGVNRENAATKELDVAAKDDTLTRQEVQQQTEQTSRVAELNEQLAAQNSQLIQQSAGRIAQMTTVENAQSPAILNISNSNAFGQTSPIGGNGGAANNYAFTLPDQSAANTAGDPNKSNGRGDATQMGADGQLPQLLHPPLDENFPNAGNNFDVNNAQIGDKRTALKILNGENALQEHDGEKRDKEDVREKNLKLIAEVTPATNGRDLGANEREETAREMKRLAEDNAKMHKIVTKLQMAATVEHKEQAGESKLTIEGGDGSLNGQNRRQDQFRREYRSAKQDHDEAAIANDPLIKYPSNWDQISKHADLAIAPKDFRRTFKSGALGSPVLSQGPTQNPLLDASKSEELNLRGFRALHEENPKLVFSQFIRHPDVAHPVPLTDEGMDEDDYINKYGTRPFVDCARDHLSTFGMDVDTAAYTLARAALRGDTLPPPETVRVEEFVNYFKQAYSVQGNEAFGVFAESAQSPFVDTNVQARDAALLGTENVHTRELLKIGIKSREARPGERKPAMLTFVIDTSGSMSRATTGSPSRLALVKQSLTNLLNALNPDDAISIVGFGDQAELILPRTQARQKNRILEAIDAMTAGGSTNVEAGLNLGYRMADEAYATNAVNRMVLFSDGVANVGEKGPEEILKLVAIFAHRGIDLSTIGIGMNRVNDPMLRTLADAGNGSCHFADTSDEANKILVEKLPPHLNVLARDAKVQVDFNVDTVKSYRLLGYEKRKIADKDFRNDKIDSGDVGHDTLVTVFYEIERQSGVHGPLGKVYLRWKDAGSPRLEVVERNYPLEESTYAGAAKNASPDFRFLACVARFAELLRDSKWVRHGSYAEVLAELDKLPNDFKAKPECAEVKDLIERAQRLSIAKWKSELK